MKKYDLCIAGACASGLAAAVSAKRAHPGYRIAMLEKLPRIGKKILVTGNGRCNLTNLNASPEDYNNPGFAAECFKKYPPRDVVSFFESLGLITFTDEAGRVYPRSNTASSVLDALRFSGELSEVDILTETPVNSVEKTADGFIINGEISCDKLIIATGGKASPSQGSDGSGYAIAKSLGHTVTRLCPSLVPINSRPDEVKGLKGIRAGNVRLTLKTDDDSYSSSGELLFTDNGISGICAMELAKYAENALKDRKNAKIVIDFLPDMSEEELKEYILDVSVMKAGQPLEIMLTGILPKQLGISVLKRAGVYLGGANIESFSESMAENVCLAVKQYSISVTGTKGFENAQVTAGGIDTDEVNPSSLESKLCKNLYFCGEILDVDGKCGGYNLQWAFASGLLAGELL